MSWIYLFIAGLLEVGWAVGLKYTDGFRRLGPSLLVGLMILASMGLLAMAVRSIPIGTAYAVWVGIGVLGVALVGVFHFGEPLSVFRLVCLLALLLGILGLKLTS